MSLLLLFSGKLTSVVVAPYNPIWNSDWIPDFVFVQSYAFDTIRTPMKLGPQRRRAIRGVSIGTFELNFSNISKALATSIHTFYVESRGPFRPFTWTNPVDGISYSVRFADDVIEREEIGEDLINMKIKLAQTL